MSHSETKPTVAERLAHVRAEKARQAAEDKEKQDLAEIERFELAERFSKELGGKEGEAFAVIDATVTGDGFIVVKLGASVLWRTYVASTQGVVDLDALVSPCVVYPTLPEYRSIVARRTIIATTCANALTELYGFKASYDKGK